MFLNNLGGLYRTNWANPVWGPTLFANQVPYYGTQVGCAVPHSTLPITGNVPFYGLGNQGYPMMGNQGYPAMLNHFIPQSIAQQTVNPLATGCVPGVNQLPFNQIPFAGASLGQGGFTPQTVNPLAMGCVPGVNQIPFNQIPFTGASLGSQTVNPLAGYGYASSFNQIPFAGAFLGQGGFTPQTVNPLALGYTTSFNQIPFAGNPLAQGGLGTGTFGQSFTHPFWSGINNPFLGCC